MHEVWKWAWDPVAPSRSGIISRKIRTNIHAYKSFEKQNKLSWQDTYISKMTYKPSELGQTDLVFGL